MKALLAPTAAMLAALPICASAAGPVGGQFEMFDVAVEGTRVIGRYLKEQGTGPVRRRSSPLRARSAPTSMRRRRLLAPVARCPAR